MQMQLLFGGFDFLLAPLVPVMLVNERNPWVIVVELHMSILLVPGGALTVNLEGQALCRRPPAPRA